MTNKQLGFILDCIKEKDKILGSMGWLDRKWEKRGAMTHIPAFCFSEQADTTLTIRDRGDTFEVDLSIELLKKVFALIMDDYESRLRAIEDALNGIETNLPNIPGDEKVQF